MRHKFATFAERRAAGLGPTSGCRDRRGAGLRRRVGVRHGPCRTRGPASKSSSRSALSPEQLPERWQCGARLAGDGARDRNRGGAITSCGRVWRLSRRRRDHEPGAAENHESDRRASVLGRRGSRCRLAWKGALEGALLHLRPPGRSILLIALGGMLLQLTLREAEQPVAASAESLPLYCPPDFDKRFGFA
jgi:hypothetical protein